MSELNNRINNSIKIGILFAQKVIWFAEKHMKRCSITLIIGKMKLKPQEVSLYNTGKAKIMKALPGPKRWLSR